MLCGPVLTEPLARSPIVQPALQEFTRHYLESLQ